MPVVKNEILKQEDVEQCNPQGYVFPAELNLEVDPLIGANIPEALHVVILWMPLYLSHIKSEQVLQCPSV